MARAEALSTLAAADWVYLSIWTAGLAEVDSGVPDNDVDAG